MFLSLLAGAAIGTPAYEATIRRDTIGVAHVEGESDADAVFGMIYAQAEDDFPRIERNYLENLGRLAEAEGEGALWSDLRQRLWIDEADLRARYAGSPAWLQELCRAWAAGLNQYLADHPEVRPKAFTKFEPWMPLGFSEGSIGADFTQVPLSALKAFYGDGQEAPKVASRAMPAEHAGSNGIAIAPKLSADGRTLLLINPHTTLFFRDVVHMRSGEGLDAYGAVTWGQFFVYQGFNRRLGWMHTTSGLDNVDHFAVAFETDDTGRMTYRFGEELREITPRQVDIKVRMADGSFETRSFRTLATHHGPVTRLEGGKLVSTALMHRPVEALEQSFLRTKATSLNDYLEVAKRRANSSNNTVYADADGRIALLLPQFLPTKDDSFDHHSIVDGNNPAAAWGALRGIDELPSAIDPASGYVYNVNNDPWSAAGPGTFDPAEYPDDIDRFGWNPRSDHALKLLIGADGWTVARLRDAAYDTYQPAFDGLLDKLAQAQRRMGAGERKTRLAAPAEALARWDQRWSATDQVQALAIEWIEALHETNKDGSAERYTYAADFAGYRAASDEQLLAALEAAVTKLERQWGDWRVPWGEVHRYQRNDGAVRQAFDDLKPSLPVPFTPGWTGSLATSNADEVAGQRRRYNSRGNSIVAVVAFSPQGPEAWMVTAGGVSGDPQSPHFSDQAGNHVLGVLQKVPLTEGEIAAAAQSTYRVSYSGD
ncbi:penicillin acylase family protein [Altererythrobacter arenosus]|uniref:Penicillin acylase family protein n=1 Tax=Altererythrobacter arenosus TaxID=3032592 RepID=A0ABY8FNT0_9SPHN|nr:penicillin acylase family protein [Altererythrobacter sp. CAU 1644]WFL76678.1 penicillin acylase family protein [Altererythrobacter sp. CAU 1644]